ncbi:tail fiber protein [Chryseobacterium sp. Ch-15]|uniref:Phage tail protein n=1 Tax=Chryseobacterium muglaense TaxID=2893752 RepID=A0A9Q3UXD4_9FLAO|nr:MULTISPECIES: tail fiber protein [Chryseobacterium]MBD3903417.1 phage tail protein [Chryseobacterium muglaense]MBO6183329.1 phage tail protein [Chryseobacterium sp.]MCC9036317.1 tail fiber protein [Chryseobacterium muglaense]MCM2554804.1 tail fiber protein [Chryseobacterium muglaense]
MEGYIGEIRLFAGNFAPRGWVFCDGTQYSISMYQAVFSILGTTYGGNGQTTFGAPDLRGRLAVGTGQGAGLSNIELGQVGGTETVTMNTTQMPMHTHTAMATIAFPAFSEAGDTGTPSGAILGGLQGAYSSQSADTNIAPATASGTLSNVGGGIPFEIIQPVLAANYIICFEGIYPSRS